MDITADDLEVLEDGVAQKVDTFQEAVDPVSIVLELDASGSMKKSAEPRSRRRRATSCAPCGRKTSSRSSRSPTRRCSRTRSRPTAQWTLDAIDKYNRDRRDGALRRACGTRCMHLKDVPGRHAVVVLTDGTRREQPRNGARQHAHARRGAEARTVGRGDDVSDRPRPEGRTRRCSTAWPPNRAARPTTRPTRRALADQFGMIVDNLRRRYVLGYTSTNSNHDGGWRSIEIRARSGKLSVSSLGGYFAPER